MEAVAPQRKAALGAILTDVRLFLRSELSRAEIVGDEWGGVETK